MTKRRSVRLILYVELVIAAALIATALLPHDSLWTHPGTFSVVLAMTIAAGAYPVRLPGLRHEITATHPFILFALALLGPLPAVLVALGGVLGAAAGRSGRWPAPLKLAFNLAAIALSTALAAWTFVLVGGATPLLLPALMTPLAAATIVYAIGNTGLAALAIAIDKGQPVSSTWWRCFSYTVVSYVSGLTLAVAMIGVREALLPWGLLLAAALCPLLVMFYRSQAERLTLRQAR